jgi:transposase
MIAAMTAATSEVSASRQVDTKISRADERRHWPEDLKRRMVAETQQPGASVSIVARHYDVNANQLFKWRRHYRSVTQTPAFVPVGIEEEAEPASKRRAVQRLGDEREGKIEIDLPGGICVRVRGAVDVALLRQVLEALR